MAHENDHSSKKEIGVTENRTIIRAGIIRQLGEYCSQKSASVLFRNLVFFRCVQMEHALQYKIVLVGDPKTGKTWFANKLRGAPFDESDNYNPTQNDDVHRVTINLNSIGTVLSFRVDLWDTMSENARFRRQSSPYYRARGVILFVDVTNRALFEKLEHWLQDIDRYTSETCCILIVANKVDDIENRQVATVEIQEFVAKMSPDERYSQRNLQMIEMSVKNNYNVRKALDMLCNTIYTADAKRKPSSGIDSETSNSKDKKSKDKNCKLQ